MTAKAGEEAVRSIYAADISSSHSHRLTRSISRIRCANKHWEGTSLNPASCFSEFSSGSACIKLTATSDRHMFSGASSVLINGGTFNASTHVQVASARGIERLLQAAAPGALHNSGERFDPPKCHPNTRTAVLNKLKEWVRGEVDTDRLIMWLYGAAGAGKSAIAQTLAEICAEEGLLLASFFFSKTASARSTAQHFVATIAYQVALAIPGASPLIESAVARNPMIFHQSIETQLFALVRDPLNQLSQSTDVKTTSPALVVVDGLDECQDSTTQCQILKAVLKTVRDCGFTLRVLVASRPEPHLRLAINAKDIDSLLLRIALDDSYSPDDDIRLFLNESFTSIRHEHPVAFAIPPSWPSPNVINQLVDKSSGQFIYASTVVKYVGSPQHRPIDRMEEVLGTSPPPNKEDMPFAELNALYTHIFQTVDNVGRTLMALSAILLLNNLPLNSPFFMSDDFINLNTTFLKSRLAQRTEDIDRLLLWQPGDTRLCLKSIASLVEYDYSGFVTIQHASLEDFLFDRDRSKQFFIDRDAAFAHFMTIWLRYLGDARSVSTPTAKAVLEIIPPCCPLLRLTPELKQDLFDVSFAMLSQKRDPAHTVHYLWDFMGSFITTMKRLNLLDHHAHHLAEFDRSLYKVLAQYPAPPHYLINAHLLFVRHVSANNWVHIPRADIERLVESKPHSGLVEFDLKLGFRLSCIMIQAPSVYSEHLCQFFMDRDRAGEFAVNPEMHLSTALHWLRLLPTTTSKFTLLILELLFHCLPKAKRDYSLPLFIAESGVLDQWPLNDPSINHVQQVREVLLGLLPTCLCRLCLRQMHRTMSHTEQPPETE